MWNISKIQKMKQCIKKIFSSQHKFYNLTKIKFVIKYKFVFAFKKQWTLTLTPQIFDLQVRFAPKVGCNIICVFLFPKLFTCNLNTKFIFIS